MRDSRWLRAVVALALVGTLAACSSAEDVATDDETSSTPSPSPTSEPSEDPPTTEPTAEPDTPGGLPEGIGKGPAGKGLDRFYQQEVSWAGCDGDYECADIWVPLDYDRPDGQAITIKAKRDPAGDPAQRRGSMFINPGGPGGSGINYLAYANFDETITDVYDVIGFDPRGVASSTPVDCISDQELDAYVASDPSPDNNAEIKDFQQIWTNFTTGCTQESGPLLGHVSTPEAARDIDIMREVVGDPKLNYFGASYGTYLGATYAGLFPDKVGRLVLDGAVDPLADPRQSAIDQAAGFDVALTAYLEYCVAEGDCPLGDSVDAARDRLNELFKEIDQQPLSTSSGREVTEGVAFLGVIVPLYNRDYWSLETQALEGALEGEGDVLLQLADAYTERAPDGTYPNNNMEVQPAVNCLDKPENATIPEIKRNGDDFTDAAPVFGQVAMWWPYACSNWPVQASEPKPDYTAKGADPILVVGTTRDPATPYEQAVKLARTLESGVLLTRDGDGHTAYGAGNECIDDTINDYLAEGVVPSDGMRC